MFDHTCSNPICKRRRGRSGYCGTHYVQMWRRLLTAQKRGPDRGGLCLVEGCIRAKHYTGRYCGMHAYRLRTRGHAGSSEPEVTRGLVHGTEYGYRKFKCRCAGCSGAWREKQRAYRERNREAYRERQTLKRELTKEQQRVYKRRWAHKNPGSNRTSAVARAAAPADALALEYIQVIRRDPCVYCGGAMSDVDHIEPLARRGETRWFNLAPTCASCNRSKGAKGLLEFLMYRQMKAALLAQQV